MLIYPRQRIPNKLKVGAVPGTFFQCSPNGWINQELFTKWFQFFLQSIPPARPVLIIEDGHSSHISIEVIEEARKNDVHLLCLPSHTYAYSLALRRCSVQVTEGQLRQGMQAIPC